MHLAFVWSDELCSFGRMLRSLSDSVFERRTSTAFFCIIGEWFGWNSRVNRLYKRKETWQYKFVSVKAYKKREGLTSGWRVCKLSHVCWVCVAQTRLCLSSQIFVRPPRSPEFFRSYLASCNNFSIYLVCANWNKLLFLPSFISFLLLLLLLLPPLKTNIIHYWFSLWICGTIIIYIVLYYAAVCRRWVK